MAIAFISFRKSKKRISKGEGDKQLDLENNRSVNDQLSLNDGKIDDVIASSPVFSGEVTCSKASEFKVDITEEQVQFLNFVSPVVEDEPQVINDTDISIHEKDVPKVEDNPEVVNVKDNSVRDKAAYIRPEIRSLNQQENKLKSHCQKSRIPHYFQADKSKPFSDEAKRNIPIAKHHKLYRDDFISKQRSSLKQLRFGNMSPMKKMENEDDLKRKYKSLFRSKQEFSRTPICAGNIVPDLGVVKDHFESSESNELHISKQDSLITDEDGSNLLVESGFFDNDMLASPESQEMLNETFASVSSLEPPQTAEDVSPNFEQPIKLESPCFHQNERDASSDEALFKEAEEELIMNLAIQNIDVNLLLEIISKTESIRLLARGFQALADLSKDCSTHELFKQYLTLIYSCLDLESDALKVDVLKVLLNLSRNANMLVPLLSEKAPASLLKYFLLEIDEEVQLTWLAFVVNAFDHWKRNKSFLQNDESLKSENVVCGVLFGSRFSRVIRSRIYMLTRHRNRHINHVARQIYADMSR